ncbi:hypothetical protein STAS_06268 [Striga asiatica]|uniref:Uncharacterized protein n=1 Tax=Striga asiatica TaxID=4170 RepID=A0A5A7PCD4_STRAF|nr:hypothetical protein STAS_06268 [Striga asiatica]
MDQSSFLNLISIRRNQVPLDQELDDLELFQKHVSIRFSYLLPSSDPSSTTTTPDNQPPPGPPPPFLSIPWLRDLLDTFLCCEAEFKAVLILDRDPSQFSRPPLDRLIPDLLDRTLKSLDLLTSVSLALDHLSSISLLLARISLSSLSPSPLTSGHVRRSLRSLSSLLSSLKSSSPKSRSWSAAKQIQSMSANLVAPRGTDSSGPAQPVYIMSTVLVFTMWALAAAVPCQDRVGLPAHVPAPAGRGPGGCWAQPIAGLVEKIGEEWKKKEKVGGAGLLEEVVRMEKAAQALAEMAEGFVYPMEEERAAEVAATVEEMAEVCRRMEEGLGPLKKQVREVFHRMVRSRAEILDVLDQVTKSSVPVPY